ncbi:MAG TPA: hypothetical protein VHQ65_05190, partial [Thermoanaerobaculia bacterium]|nr:hypothetical protein [Thermoanaerobaculia bacterium]
AAPASPGRAAKAAPAKKPRRPRGPGLRATARHLPGVLAAAVRRPIAEPRVLGFFLLLNLATALVLVAPLRGVLSARLDSNLYGDVMETGASWRWFDTVTRQHPEALGDLGAWTALFSAEGVRLSDLAALSGPAAAVAVAMLLVYLLTAVLHTGWLAAGRFRAGTGGGTVAPLLHRAALFAGPTLLLALAALLLYAGTYALFAVALGVPLDRLALWLQSERAHLTLLWGRLGLTVLAWLVVKIWFDLAKAALVEGLPAHRAAARALRELGRRGWAYLLLYTLLATVGLALAFLWMLLTAPLVPETWLGLVILFLLHQVYLAVRIGLRLARLGAAQGLLLSGTGSAAISPPPARPPAAG